MNLLIRVLWVLIYASFKRRQPLSDVCVRTPFLVFPNDLDFNFHVNNGRYLTFADLGKIDLLVRTGLLSLMFFKGWSPIVGEAQIQFKKSARLFDLIVLETRLERMDQKRFYLSHKFFRKGFLVAQAHTTGLLASKRRIVQPLKVIEHLEHRKHLSSLSK